MAEKDERNYRRIGAEWGWIQCRRVVYEAAVRFFGMENDEAACLLRNLANHDLVIGADTFADAPREHCESGCDCGASEEARDD